MRGLGAHERETVRNAQTFGISIEGLRVAEALSNPPVAAQQDESQDEPVPPRSEKFTLTRDEALAQNSVAEM